MKEIHKIERSLEPLRITLQQHPLYHSLNSLEDVSTFMEQHPPRGLGFYVPIKSATTTTVLREFTLAASKKSNPI